MAGVHLSTLGPADPGATLAVAGDLLAGRARAQVTVWSGLDAAHLERDSSWAAEDLDEIGLSPSGRFLLGRPAARDVLEVRRTVDGAPVVRLEAEAGRPWAVGAVVATPGGELLVASVRPRRLYVRRLSSDEVLHDGTVSGLEGFTYATLVPMLDGDTVAAVGYHPGEGKETLVFVSIRELLAGSGTGPPAARPARTVDDAYGLAVGPCGPAAAVVYRNPEDGEEPEEDEPDDPNRLDVYGVHGLYVRRLSDLTVGPELGVDVRMPTGTPLLSTEEHVLAALAHGVLVVPRSGAPVTMVPATRVALDPPSGRAALVTAQGELRLLTVS